MGIVIETGLGGGGQALASVVPQYLQAQEEERRYQLAKQKAVTQEAATRQEMSQSSEAFGWQREQHARLKALQDAAGSGPMVEGQGGAPGPAAFGTQGPTPAGAPVQTEQAGPAMSPQQAIGGSDSDFEKMLQGQLETSGRIARNLMALDPVHGAEFAARHMEESRQIFTQLALEHARTKALGDVSSSIAHGEYSVPLLSGQGEDPTFSMLAQSKLAQLQIPGTDPRPILSELDDLKGKAHLQAYNNARLGTRMASAEEEVKKRVAEGKPGDADGVARLVDLAKRGAITPEQWDAQIDDAIHGRTDIKEKNAALQAENEQAKTALAQAQAELARMHSGFFGAKTTTEQKKGDNLLLPGQGKSLSLDRRVVEAGKRAEKDYSDTLTGMMASGASKDEIKAFTGDREKFMDRARNKYLGMMAPASPAAPGAAPSGAPTGAGGATPASDFLRDMKAGKIVNRDQFNSLAQQNGWVDANGQPSLEAIEAAAAKEGQ